MTNAAPRQSQTAVPEPLARIAEVMSTFRPDWFLCGGWAADSWLGSQTRSHGDVDITAFHDDQRALFDHLAGWELIGHDDNVADDSPEPWTGRTLDLPAHVHAHSRDGFNLEIILNDRTDGDWIFNRQPPITLPLERCTRESAWGLPTVTPEVILFYKAHPPAWRDTSPPALRPHDELDLLALLPHLTRQQRNWLCAAIALVDPGHPWLPRLAQDDAAEGTQDHDQDHDTDGER